MTLSLINSKNDFDFVGWVMKTLCVFYFLFYFRSVKFHYVKETLMMLVPFRRWWKLLQHLGTKESERNLCQDLLTIEKPTRIWKCTRCAMQMSYLYASVSFQKLLQLAKQTEAIRNYQTRVWLWLSTVWETHKLTRYQSIEFSYITFPYRTSAKAYA